MPSEEDFKTLKNLVKANSLEEVKKMLQRDDAKALLKMTDCSGNTALMHACYNSDNVKDTHKAMSLDMIKLLFTEIKRIGEKKFLKEQLALTDNGGWNRLMDVCYYSPSNEIIQYVVDTILEVGGRKFLREQLEVKNTNHKRTTFYVACCNPSITAEYLVLLSSILFEFGIFKKQYDELTESRKSTLKNHGIDASWNPQQHFNKILESETDDAIAYFKSLLVYAPISALDYIKSNNLLGGSDGLSSSSIPRHLLAIENVSTETLVTLCAMFFERGTFENQYSLLDGIRRDQLTRQGITAQWTPERQINKMVESDPAEVLHQVNLLCKYTSKPPLTFLNEKVFPSQKLLRVFSAPSIVNYLAERKRTGSLPADLDRVYNRLMLRTFHKIDLVTEHQEPDGRKRVLQANLDNTRSLRQHAFQEGAIRVHEDALKSSFEEFRNLYCDFFKKKLEIDQEAAHRELVQIETQQVSLLVHHGLVESLSIKRTHFITKSANTLRRQSANILKTAPLRRVSEKHNIALPESDIQNLSNHNIMGGGKFDINILDGFLLDEMKVPQDSRTAILNLVRLHRNEAFVDMQRLVQQMQERAQETEKRYELKDSLFSLQQEKSSLIMKLRDSQLKERWLDSINHSMKIQTATIKELEEAVNDLENQILDLTQLVDHEKTSSPRSTDNSGHAQTLAHGNNDDHDDVEDDGFSERSSDEQSKDTYALEVRKEMVKYRPSSSNDTKSFKSLESNEV